MVARYYFTLERANFHFGMLCVIYIYFLNEPQGDLLLDDLKYHPRD